MKKDNFKRDPNRSLSISKLIVDSDKDWGGKGITNIAALSSSANLGDIVARGAAVIRRLAPGTTGYVLTSGGPGHMPYWAPASSAFEKNFGAFIYGDTVSFVKSTRKSTLLASDVDDEVINVAPGAMSSPDDLDWIISADIDFSVSAALATIGATTSANASITSVMTHAVA